MVGGSGSIAMGNGAVAIGDSMVDFTGGLFGDTNVGSTAIGSGMAVGGSNISLGSYNIFGQNNVGLGLGVNFPSLPNAWSNQGPRLGRVNGFIQGTPNIGGFNNTVVGNSSFVFSENSSTSVGYGNAYWVDSLLLLVRVNGGFCAPWQVFSGSNLTDLDNFLSSVTDCVAQWGRLWNDQQVAC